MTSLSYFTYSQPLYRIYSLPGRLDSVIRLYEGIFRHLRLVGAGAGDHQFQVKTFSDVHAVELGTLTSVFRCGCCPS